MKTIFVLTALVAFATASATPDTRGLKEDFQDFADLVPVDKFVGLALRYLTTDKEFKEFFAYLKGQEFSAVWDQFFALKEVKDVLNYLEDAHLDVYNALNFVADFLGLHHVQPTVLSLKAGGLCGFVDETLALLPLDKFQTLFEEKLKTSPEFKAFYEKLRNIDFHKFVDFYNNSKEVQSLFQKLRNYGVDVDSFFDLVAGFFGWGKFQ
ncbi:protein G12-like [Ochlerotatus camptorhynchus]|uniref:protein G12-like n=1 Tax=Ochlerotatus camptorhynchus TaxID=644619 RepID=UPI0031DC003B